jgi:hypothetical protein
MTNECLVEEKKEADSEDQRIKQALDKEPELDTLKLDQKWIMWEHYETGSQTTSFEEQMSRVCWFNDMASFAAVWSRIPHRDLSNFFYNSAKQMVPT